MHIRIKHYEIWGYEFNKTELNSLRVCHERRKMLSCSQWHTRCLKVMFHVRSTNPTWIFSCKILFWTNKITSAYVSHYMHALTFSLYVKIKKMNTVYLLQNKYFLYNCPLIKSSNITTLRKYDFHSSILVLHVVNEMV